MKKQYRIRKTGEGEDEYGNTVPVGEEDVFVTDDLKKTIDQYVDKDTRAVLFMIQHDYVEE